MEHFHRVQGTRKDLYLGNSSKCVPILRGSNLRWVRGKGKEKEGSHGWRDAKTSELAGHHDDDGTLLERRIIGSAAYSQ